MKFFIFTLCLFVIIGLSANVFGQDIKNYYGYNEEPCSKAGGRCIYKEQCTEFTEESGLCPEQQENGFECCYGGPKSETRCRELGGACFDRNYCKDPNLNATDCPRGQVCCILK